MVIIKKKYLLVILIILIFSINCSAQNSFDIIANNISYSQKANTIKAEIILTSLETIKQAQVFYYNPDGNEKITYEIPEEKLGRNLLELNIEVDKSEIDIEKNIHFNLTAYNSNGDKFERQYYYNPDYNWKKKEWQVVENEHIILNHMYWNEKIIKQISNIAENTYMSIKNILEIKENKKIKIYLLNSYEQFYFVDGIRKYGLGHWSGIFTEQPSGYTTNENVIYIYLNFNRVKLKRIITHELTHFLFEEFMLQEDLTNIPPSWFREMLSQYISYKVTFGEEFMNKITSRNDQNLLEEGFSSVMWKYNVGISTVFFEYLFEKYQSNNITKVLKQYIASQDRQKQRIPDDFYSFLYKKYNLSKYEMNMGSSNNYKMKISNKQSANYNQNNNKVLVTLRGALSLKQKLDYDIGIYDLKNDKLIKLTNNYLNEYRPIWGKNNEYIYYVQQTGDKYNVMKMNLDNKLPRKIFTTTKYLYNLELAPDGTKIVYTLIEDLNNTSLWIYNIKKEESVRLTNGDAFDYSPIFYNNEKILYISNRKKNKSNIFKMNLSSHKVETISGTENSRLIIKSENNYCLFFKGFFNQLYLVDIKNGNIKRVFKDEIKSVWFPDLNNDIIRYYDGRDRAKLIYKGVRINNLLN